MSTNLREFDRQMLQITRDLLPQQLVQFHQKIALEAYTRIIQKTPVGNPDLWKSSAPPGYVGGRARSNWFISVATPIEAVRGVINGVQQSPETAALGEGLSQLAGLKPFQVIWITNSLPYIEALEHGHSRQAPAGMVSLTLAELEAMFP